MTVFGVIRRVDDHPGPLPLRDRVPRACRRGLGAARDRGFYRFPAAKRPRIFPEPGPEKWDSSGLVNRDCPEQFRGVCLKQGLRGFQRTTLLWVFMGLRSNATKAPI